MINRKETLQAANYKRLPMKRKVLLLCFMSAVFSVCGQSFDFEKLKSPPAECRPQLWWHWMNGNITKEGIRKDLLWMDSVGIGGIHIFDVGLNMPQIVEKRLGCFTPEWNDAFAFALRIADSLSLKVAMVSSPGWSATGGPWVSREDAMKTLNWKEMLLEGGKKYKGPLPEPNTVAGKYLTHLLLKNEPDKYRFYQDLFVYAVRMPEADRSMEELNVRASASDASDLQALFDDDLATRCVVRPDASGRAWILFEFAQPQTIKAIMQGYDDDRRDRSGRRWEYSMDGEHFHTITDTCPRCGIPYLTFNIPPTSARYLRVSANQQAESLDYNEVKFYTTNRVHFDTEKAGFFSEAGFSERYPTQADADAVAREDILDITSRYHNGVLKWKVPEGRWRIYRVGYTLRGRQNNPASPEATGLEVNKLDKGAITRYYRNYFARMDSASPHCIGSTIKYLMVDSYEAGSQTWTDSMAVEFERRRGYSLMSWMPALFGIVVESPEKTERFLQDWRQTFGELFAENHYWYVDSLCAEYGLQTFVESHEHDRKVPADGMDMKVKASVPMGAFWVEKNAALESAHQADLMESASVAHLFGQNVNAAESFSVNGMHKSDGKTQSAYAFCPENLKPYADGAMACGLNQFVIHNSSHQPVDDKVPGLGLGVFGQWFHRHETWAYQAKPWMDYLARSSYLLRQGRFVADFALLYGESTNLTALYLKKNPPLMAGYAYDFVSANIFIHSLKMEGNALVAPSGMRYTALLIEPEVKYMSIDVLRKLSEAVCAGLLVAGTAPEGCLNLKYDSLEFRYLVDEIWHRGRANVVAVTEFERELQKRREKQVVFENPDEHLRFVHRQLEDADLFWVANLSPTAREAEVSFNVYGKKPLLLHVEDGSVETPAYTMKDGRTSVTLSFKPHDAFFVLFEQQTEQLAAVSPQQEVRPWLKIKGPWALYFQKGRGAPDTTVFDTLYSYTLSAETGVRYFSGTATYQKQFDLEYFDNRQPYWLDLGSVKNIARVRLNGRDLGIVWKPPFRMDVTGALQKGVNTLEIEVTNLWPNRIIGDQQPGVKEKITYTACPFYTADAPLLESGLLGPVQLMR